MRKCFFCGGSDTVPSISLPTEGPATGSTRWPQHGRCSNALPPSSCNRHQHQPRPIRARESALQLRPAVSSRTVSSLQPGLLQLAAGIPHSACTDRGRLREPGGSSFSGIQGFLGWRRRACSARILRDLLFPYMRGPRHDSGERANQAACVPRPVVAIASRWNSSGSARPRSLPVELFRPNPLLAVADQSYAPLQTPGSEIRERWGRLFCVFCGTVKARHGAMQAFKMQVGAVMFPHFH